MYLAYFTLKNRYTNTRFIYQKNDEILGILVSIIFEISLLVINGNINGIIKDFLYTLR